MLTALTWAFGAGFPEEEWIAVASQLAGVELGRDHVSWVLDGLGRYVVQGGEGGTAVYRVAHQSLADHLRPSYRRTGERPFDPAAEPVWAALAARHAALITSGQPAHAPTYLWRCAYRHAAAVGIGGLPALRELASAAGELRPDVAVGALGVAEILAAWGRRTEAVAPTEEAVALCRSLAVHNPAYASDLAGALNNFSVRYSAVGRRAEALAPAEEAVALYRHLAAHNPAYAPELARSLNNLGVHYGEVGRWDEALGPTEEAVALYRNLAVDTSAYAPGLAMVLTNLGLCYSAVGQRTEAVTPTEQAVTLYRNLAAENPAHTPKLATALTNLGLCYREVGRRTEALAPTEEAITLYRHLAADHPAYVPDLVRALINLDRHLVANRRRRPRRGCVAAGLGRARPVHASDIAATPSLRGRPRRSTGSRLAG